MERFEQVISRRGTMSRKWDSLQERYGADDLMSLWIADMDFISPEPIRKALAERSIRGDYGYVQISEACHQGIEEWFKRRHQWTVKREHLVFTPGLLAGISFSLEALTQVGDSILIQPPVYPPFAGIVNRMKRKLLENPLVETQPGFYEMDFNQLEELLKKEQPKWLVFCNPQNPTGRVWKEEELITLATLCSRYNVSVLSDEIHGDLVFGENKYIPFAKVAEPLGVTVLTGFAGSKTFNLAGLTTAFWIIPQQELRRQVVEMVGRYQVSEANLFGIIALGTCFTDPGCEEWLEELKKYLFYNAYYVNEMLNYHAPGIKANFPEGTYMSWLDCRELGLSQEKLQRFFVENAKVALNDGTTFGSEGLGFMRLNFGCPRSQLRQALERIVEATRAAKGWKS